MTTRQRTTRGRERRSLPTHDGSHVLQPSMYAERPGRSRDTFPFMQQFPIFRGFVQVAAMWPPGGGGTRLVAASRDTSPSTSDERDPNVS
jgi:hypothetical protein